MGVTIDSILIRDKSLAATDLDGRVVVLSVDSGSYVSFNGVASEIWHMLCEPRRVRDIFDDLSRRHDVDDTKLSRDVLPFLQELIEKKLAQHVHQDVIQ